VEPALRIPEFQPDLRHWTTSESSSSSSSSSGGGGGSGGGDADAAVLAGDKMSSSPARRHRPRSTVCRRRRVMEDRGHMAGKAPPPITTIRRARGALSPAKADGGRGERGTNTLQAHRRDVREVIVHADWTYCRAARNRLFSR